MERPLESIWDWVASNLPAPKIVAKTSHDHGYSNLWRILSGSDHFWLKMHAFPGKWAGEIHALTHWTPAIGLAPTVIAFQQDPPAVILTESPGVDAEGIDLTTEGEERLWQGAGAWLGRLHAKTSPWLGAVNPDGSPNGVASTDPEAFVQATFDRRIQEGKDMELLRLEEIQFIQFGMAEWLPSLRGEPAFAIHRDFSPRNWLVGPDGGLTGVIDFEHARWDVRAADLNRWWDHEFLRSPRLRDVFFEAYGPVDEKLNRQLQALRLLQAAGGYVWATLVKDIAYAERNRGALHRMMENPRLPFS